MDEIVTELTDGILRVELNRPEKKNALTSAMYTWLAEIFEVANSDTSVRAVVWHGAGDSFCAGNDLSDFLNNPPEGGVSPQRRLTDSFIAFDKPIVVAVHGFAVGGGTTMLTHCDFVYASETARFQIPFVNLALVPEFGSSFSVPARAGHLNAAELFLLGEPFTAERAAELRLVTKVVPEAEVLASAMATAKKLASKPAETLVAIKRLIKHPFAAQLREAVDIEAQEFTQRLQSAEAKEAFAAFLEKRPPNFAAPRQKEAETQAA